MSASFTGRLTRMLTPPEELRAVQRAALARIEDGRQRTRARADRLPWEALDAGVRALDTLVTELEAVLRVCGDDAHRAEIGVQELFDELERTHIDGMTDEERELMHTTLMDGDWDFLATVMHEGKNGAAAKTAFTMIARTVWQDPEGAAGELDALLDALRYYKPEEDEDNLTEIERLAAAALHEYVRQAPPSDVLHQGLTAVASALRSGGHRGQVAAGVIDRLAHDGDGERARQLAAFRAQDWLRSEHGRGLAPDEPERERTLRMYREAELATGLLRAGLLTPLEAQGRVLAVLE